MKDKKKHVSNFQFTPFMTHIHALLPHKGTFVFCEGSKIEIYMFRMLEIVKNFEKLHLGTV